MVGCTFVCTVLIEINSNQEVSCTCSCTSLTELNSNQVVGCTCGCTLLTEINSSQVCRLYVRLCVYWLRLTLIRFAVVRLWYVYWLRLTLIRFVGCTFVVRVLTEINSSQVWLYVIVRVLIEINSNQICCTFGCTSVGSQENFIGIKGYTIWVRL